MLALLAHAGHGGSPNFPFLIGAGVALVVGVIVGTAKWAKPWMSWTSLGAAVVLGALSMAISPSHPAAGGVGIRLLDPPPDAVVQAGEPVTVTVAVDNASVALSPTDTESGHVHLYVDGEVEQMPYSTQATIELEPGRHEIEVEYVDALHVSFEPRVVDSVTVTAR